MARDTVRVCVVGATGYAGVEACRLVISHPHMELAVATDRKQAGTSLSQVYPSLAGLTDIALSLPDPAQIAELSDVALLAVPHTASLDITPKLLSLGVSVVDLSADYRIKDAAVYESWYETPHTSPELLAQAVYGLPELNRRELLALADKVASGEAVLVAAPGCYPTATALAAVPALESGLAADNLVISDAISGVSGAGRKATERTHFCHANESLEAYSVAHHRHTPEIEQTLTQAAGQAISVVFTPHLAPLTRGLLATVYIKVKEGVSSQAMQDAYEARYADEALITMLPAGRMPSTGDVSGGVRAQVGIALDERTRTLIASCAIDNLGKGAAGQAVQCANIIMGLGETDGIGLAAPVV